MGQLLFLELNEISFESVSFYCSKGKLPNFRELIEEIGWSRTTSEQAYEHLEPWIQWVTAHTGLSFAEHGVFRLGDIVNRDLPQIWEMLEDKGLKVGAISPMNAKHRLRNAAFFVPDPWTATDCTAPRTLKQLSTAISQIVNDNTQSKLSFRSAAALLVGTCAYARVENYARYAKLAAGAVTKKWKKALLLDLLLADVFVSQVRRTHPDFATLFLNAGAHIQHHYMFHSAPYDGPARNPAWYAPPNADPVLEAYELYDHVVATIRRAFPAARIMLATGLHQVPYGEVLYYWRLKDHGAFLKAIDVPFERADPRMSRDFLITCADERQAEVAANRLRSAIADDGQPLFEVDNRGRDVFVMFIYPRQIDETLCFRVGDERYFPIREHVAFVAVKNGEHDGTGYFLDIGAQKGSLPPEMPLKHIPQHIMSALSV